MDSQKTVVGEPEAVIAAFDQAPALAMACEGPDLRVAALNAAARVVLGHLVPIGTGLDGLPVLAGQHLLERMREVWSGGRPFSASGWRVELPGPLGDPVEYFADFTLTPWRYGDGRMRGVIAQGADVTEHVRAGRDGPGEDITEAFQRALLPQDLPLLPGVRLAARYASADGNRTGGDWFDAVALSGGRVALVVGDVAGHGMAAAAVMGQLRAVLYDHLTDGNDPDDVLKALDRYSNMVSGARAASVCIAMLDPATGAVAYCTAGHPPPLVVSRHGRSRYLSVTGAGPLSTGAHYVCGQDVIDVDDVVLLYSDALLGRPGRTPTESASELLEASTQALLDRGSRSDAAERVCGVTLERLTGAGFTDDVTLLAAQRVRPPQALRLRLPAEPATLRSIRRHFGAWLTTIAAAAHDVFALQHAVGEVVTNAIEHSPNGGQDVHVDFTAALGQTGTVEAVVTDNGTWREPVAGASYRGRGLAMATKLVDDVRVQPGERGTTVSLVHRLRHPVSMDNGLTTRAVVATDEPFALEVSYPDGPLLEASGDINAEAAEKLSDVLLRESRGGTIAATVDLTSASRLSSAAIRVLHLAVQRSALHGRSLRLVAAAGTIARQAMENAALPQASG